MKLNLYQKTALTTVIATLVLILVGGLVRAAGAGLGCPDWPQCFGMWIPPTSAADLPAGYDASLFNPVHTWLEYVNRLVGVLIGFLITLTFVFSFRYRKTDPLITWISGLAFFLVLVQGWLGGQVVRSGLSAGMITIHMVLAMVIVNTLLFATFRAMNDRLSMTLSPSTQKRLLWISGAVLFLTLIQLVLGTQVREQVDVAKNVLDLPRESWLDTSTWLYSIHRSFSWLIIILGGLLVYQNKVLKAPRKLITTGYVIFGLIILQMFIGFGMERLDIPGVLQLLHLVSVAVLICAEFLYMLMVGFSHKKEQIPKISEKKADQVTV
ncbi:heme A synthase [Rhodohalobacter sp. SW132]|uniref:COX15/CtaA family protein n=1 Tax=Rhodohalobacter sp. SW132 TaxID=2293433 RepID=UPI000E2879A8|nr:COX15/CtaA family protein [Rhodohalobacter sp. SW132]REL33180.1 heme A synthase [Rhodohalobacter sp. SW132]